MACLSKHHKELNEEGAGKCSVPMWMWGCPAGFCDQEAFGKQTEQGKKDYTGYLSGLACPAHGGPSMSPPHKPKGR